MTKLVSFKTQSDGTIFAFIVWKKGVEPVIGIASGPSAIITIPPDAQNLVIKAQGTPGTKYKFAAIETSHGPDDGKTLNKQDRQVPDSGEDYFEFNFVDSVSAPILEMIHHFEPDTP